MTLRHRPQTERPAFTLVEMLVAMALILFIMVILSEAFVAGLESFRQLKAIGDMEERLRTASVEIRRDLSADHFEGKRRLSDPNFWDIPLREGFFRIVQNSLVSPTGPNYWKEGQDDAGNVSYRATDHYLHFSVKLRGNQLDKYFTTTLPIIPETTALLAGGTTFFDQPSDGRFQEGSNVYSTPWAEVAYFLVRDPAGATAGASVPLYSLYRTQLLVTPDNRRLNWNLPGQPTIFPGGNPIPYANAAAVAAFKPLSCQPEDSMLPAAQTTLYFNNPSDLTKPFADMTNPPALRRKPRRGVYDLLNPDVTRSTLLLTDVISFQVQILPSGMVPAAAAQTPDFVDLRTAGFGAGNFDTGNLQFAGSSATGNQPPTIAAIQITLRVWDTRTEQARQITIVQDM